MRRRLATTAITLTAFALLVAAVEIASPGLSLLTAQVIAEIANRVVRAAMWPAAAVGFMWAGYQIGHMEGHRQAIQEVASATAHRVIELRRGGDQP